MWKKEAIIFFALICFFCALRGSDTFEQLPVIYNGRVVPNNTYARLWLYDTYHSEQIKKPDRHAFYANGSALNFLWQLHLLGHKRWNNAPLFWVYHSKLKQLLNLDTTSNRFSYQQLHHAIYEDEDSNLALMHYLIPYYYMKQYRDPVNRSQNKRLELTQLTPGLWATLQKDTVSILTAPKTAPWHFLKPGMQVPLSNPLQVVTDEVLKLMRALHQFEQIKGSNLQDESPLEKSVHEMETNGISPREIALNLEAQFPLEQRLTQAGSTFLTLPSRHQKGKWFSLSALNVKVYDPQAQKLIPVGNFTLYSDDLYETIQGTYFALEEAVKRRNVSESEKLTKNLSNLLSSGYASIAGKSYRKGSEKALIYPSFNQLWTEAFYYKYPFIETAIALYGVTIFLFVMGISRWANASLLIAFCLHTFILGMRCYVLQRPPVSNMFETVVYVPWVAVLAGLFLKKTLKSNFIPFAASCAALILLIVLKLTNMNSSMENVQAVLDSQYWLLVHVLMVVGSYGLFCLAGILGHLYLINYAIQGQETPVMKEIAQSTLQTMYIGIALLIPGTILGGVWAAESWGRFWDWDPKESWAFISSCIYLIWVHAYRFGYIRNLGLAVGAVVGLQAIIFTWYGVNYILGTGLHSYGFGSGGEIYYYLFLAAETLFLVVTCFLGKKSLQKKGKIR